MRKMWAWLMAKPLAALLIGAFVGMAIGGAGASTSSTATKQEPQPQVTVTTTATATETAAPATPIATKTVTVRYTAPPDATYRRIKRFTGRGTQNTEPFEVPAAASRWRICYSMSGDTNQILYIIDIASGDETSALVVNDIGSVKACSVRYEETGAQYALNVSGGKWTVDIEITG